MKGLQAAVLGALIGAVASGAGAYLTWAKDIQSRDDVIQIIETQSPYIEDRKVLAEALTEIKGLRNDVQELALKIVSLEAKLVVVHEEIHTDGEDRD